MTVEREEASALLDDVEGIESRIRQLLIYARVSDYLFLWGAILAIGFTANYFWRAQAQNLWYGIPRTPPRRPAGACRNGRQANALFPGTTDRN